MKYISHIAGTLLGLAFIAGGAFFFLGKMPPPPPAGTPPGDFMAAVGPTGYMAFIKVLEILGGIFVIVPSMRNLGLLLLGPIIVNILAFHIFLAKGAMLFDPMLITICVCALLLLLLNRKAWTGLLRA